MLTLLTEQLYPLACRWLGVTIPKQRHLRQCRQPSVSHNNHHTRQRRPQCWCGTGNLMVFSSWEQTWNSLPSPFIKPQSRNVTPMGLSVFPPVGKIFPRHHQAAAACLSLPQSRSAGLENWGMSRFPKTPERIIGQNEGGFN